MTGYPFKIGLIVDCLGLGIEKGIARAAELGAQGIQVYAVSGGMAPDNLSKAKRRDLADRIRSCGLVVSAVCGDLGGHGFTIRSDNPAKIEMSKKIMELAKDLESDVVTTHIGVVPETAGSRYETLSDACFRLGTIARAMDAVFAVETGPEKAATLRRFLDDLGTKGVGVNYDPANLVMVSGDDPVAGVALLKDYIVHTHAKDGIMIRQGDPEAIYNAFAEPDTGWIKFSDYFLETPLGEGGVDFARYLEALDAIGYKGFLTIEREVGDDPASDIAKAVSYLRKILDLGRTDPDAAGKQNKKPES